MNHTEQLKPDILSHMLHLLKIPQLTINLEGGRKNKKTLHIATNVITDKH